MGGDCIEESVHEAKATGPRSAEEACRRTLRQRDGGEAEEVGEVLVFRDHRPHRDVGGVCLAALPPGGLRPRRATAEGRVAGFVIRARIRQTLPEPAGHGYADGVSDQLPTYTLLDFFSLLHRK